MNNREQALRFIEIINTKQKFNEKIGIFETSNRIDLFVGKHRAIDVSGSKSWENLVIFLSGFACATRVLETK